MERTTDEIYDELLELRQTADRIADNIADVASAIQYFTNNLFDEQHNPELSNSVRELSAYLAKMAEAANEEAASGVQQATEVVQEAINGVLQEGVLEAEESEAADEPIREPVSEPISESAEKQETSNSLPELPEMFAWRLKGLVSFLQGEAEKLSAHHLSEEEVVWQWWEQHFEGIRDAFIQLEFLEEKAVGDGMTLRPYVEQMGGLPPAILADEWPLEMVEAVEQWEDSDDASTDADFGSGEREGQQEPREKQRALFGEEEGEASAESGVAVAERMEPLETTEEIASIEPNEEPLVSEFRESQAEGRDSLTPSPEERNHRQELRSATDADLPLEAAAPEPSPYTLEDWQTFQSSIKTGEITAQELRSQFAQMMAHEEPIIVALLKNNNAKDLKNWATRWRGRSESTKKANAQIIFQSMLMSFSLGQTISYSPFDGETYAGAVRKAVELVTDEDIAQTAASRQAEAAAHEKALTDPETLEEWRLYVRSEGGYKNLTPERKIAYERVCADCSRGNRADRKDKTISRLQLDEDLSFSIKEGFHEKKDKALWIVQLSQRVERETYKDLKAKAKELGGWFSSYKAEDTGFQFYDEAAAQLFTELLDGDVDNAEANEARKIRKMENASERFVAVADTLEHNCQEVLLGDETKLKNTVRRAGMAAGMREDAQRGLATVKTLRALAEQLASSQVKYLDGVNAATQLYTITKLLRNGKYNRIRQELAAMREGDHTGYKSHLRHEEMLEEPLCGEDIAHAEYPYPYIYKGHLEEAFTKLSDTPGVKMITRRMQKLLKTADPEKESVAFMNSRAAELLADFLRRAKSAGYKCYWFDCCMEDYNRLQAADIHSVFELRTAMRELLPYVAHPEGDDPVVKAEEELIGKKLPGFFPTPKPVIYEMLELADIQGTDRVLEPSAGKGDILDAIREAHSDVELKGIEYNRTLRDVLVAKGYGETVEFGDFTEQEGEYDKILMNPPFEKMAEIDHVRHAFELLAPGGRLVSVMSKGPFFRSDNKSREFREWLDELDHDVEELPEDAFRGTEAFRQTGVQTCLVTINKAD